MLRDIVRPTTSDIVRDLVDFKPSYDDHFLLTEAGFRLLLEDGSKIILTGAH